MNAFFFSKHTLRWVTSWVLVLLYMRCNGDKTEHGVQDSTKEGITNGLCHLENEIDEFKSVLQKNDDEYELLPIVERLLPDKSLAEQEDCLQFTDWIAKNYKRAPELTAAMCTLFFTKDEKIIKVYDILCQQGNQEGCTFVLDTIQNCDNKKEMNIEGELQRVLWDAADKDHTLLITMGVGIDKTSEYYKEKLEYCENIINSLKNRQTNLEDSKKYNTKEQLIKLVHYTAKKEKEKLHQQMLALYIYAIINHLPKD